MQHRNLKKNIPLNDGFTAGRRHLEDLVILAFCWFMAAVCKNTKDNTSGNNKPTQMRLGDSPGKYHAERQSKHKQEHTNNLPRPQVRHY
jgi:hypothetical protein